MNSLARGCARVLLEITGWFFGSPSEVFATGFVERQAGGDTGAGVLGEDLYRIGGGDFRVTGQFPNRPELAANRVGDEYVSRLAGMHAVPGMDEPGGFLLGCLIT